MTKKEYNGWYNYETWAAKLWMDEGGNFWNERAEEIYNEATGDDVTERSQNAATSLADEIEQDHWDKVPEELGGVFKDILTAGLQEINFHEIAEHLIDDVDKDEAE